MEKELLNKIIKAQEDHKTALEILINDFTPLIKKYAKRMDYEDAFADLRLQFIEIILGIDPKRFAEYEEYQMLSYLNTSVRNAYIKLSKDKCQREEHSFLVENVLDEIDKAHVDNYDDLFFDDIKKYLSKKEFEIIYRNFYCGVTIADIAKERGITRQAVNQVKTRAIKKLSKAFNKN